MEDRHTTCSPALFLSQSIRSTQTILQAWPYRPPSPVFIKCHIIIFIIYLYLFFISGTIQYLILVFEKVKWKEILNKEYKYLVTERDWERAGKRAWKSAWERAKESLRDLLIALHHFVIGWNIWLVSSAELVAPGCDGVSWIMWAALTSSASVKVKTKLTIKLLCSRLFISVSKVMPAYDRINSFCCTD